MIAGTQALLEEYGGPSGKHEASRLPLRTEFFPQPFWREELEVLLQNPIFLRHHRDQGTIHLIFLCTTENEAFLNQF